jgi:hypothetical protein
MKVFDDVERSDTSEAAYSEPTFTFLNRVGGAYWQRTRDLIEGWLDRAPSESVPDLVGRLRSTDDRAFHGAFLELYIFETLTRLGFAVEPHPEIAVSRRPDYLATKGTEKFFLEATSASDSDKKVAAARRTNAVFDAIQRVNSPNFFLDLTMTSEGDTSPSAAQLRSRLETWLASLDPDQVCEAINHSDYWTSAPRHTWTDGQWRIDFKAIPKSPGSRGLPGPVIGLYGPGKAYVLDDRSSIYRKVMDKASAYGDLGVPYIVAIRTQTFASSDTTILDALFGSEQLTVSLARGPASAQMTRKQNGVWIGPNGVRNTRVSGVLTADWLHPTTVPHNVPTLWHNPLAGHPISVSSTPWRHVIVDDTGNLKYIDPFVSPAAFFDLPQDWPGPEPPFPD